MSELSFQNLNTIIDKAGIGIFLLDSEEKFMLANQWYLRYSGLETKALLGRRILDVFPEIENSRTYKSIQFCLEDNQYSILTHTLNPFPFPLFENTQAKKNNIKIFQYLHIIPIAMSDSNRSFCMVQISDVSQQVVRENLLRDQTRLATTVKEEAIRASNSKSEFLAAMSHEIRTPLNSILGMTEVIEETKLTDDQKGFIEVLRNSGKLLLSIINDILDFSKIEAGKLDIDHYPYSLPEMIDETVSLFFLRAKNRKLNLVATLSEEIPPFLYGDPLRIQQILLNLIGNALKFTHEGTISIHVSRGFDRDSQEILQFAVTDTGIGIPVEKLGHIFKSFTQVDSSTTRKYGGTGLGLTITKRLVELMNGKIKVTSNVGKGSVFSFYLPYFPASEVNLHTPNSISDILVPSPENFPHLKILLAEDSKENVFLIQTFFRKYPIEITLAENGKIAVDLFKTNHFDLILMDMQMPVMDGNEATAQIRKWEDETNVDDEMVVPILTLTANVLKEDIKKSFTAGCTAYTTKPVKKNDLLRLIYFYTATKDVLANKEVS